MNDPGRNVEKGFEAICDNLEGDVAISPDWQGNQWYRMGGLAGTQIPEQIPGYRTCSADAPGYLKGHHPTTAGETIDGIILSSKVSWDRGNKFSAIKKLESALYKYPNSDQIYSQISYYYREIDDFDSARRYAQLRNIKSPSDSDPIIELIYLYDKYDIEDKVIEYSKQIIKVVPAVIHNGVLEIKFIKKAIAVTSAIKKIIK